MLWYPSPSKSNSRFGLGKLQLAFLVDFWIQNFVSNQYLKLPNLMRHDLAENSLHDGLLIELSLELQMVSRD